MQSEKMSPSALLPHLHPSLRARCQCCKQRLFLQMLGRPAAAPASELALPT